ncbi:RraA family protein [Streptomyces sp. N35]|uniref:RraA family protein n=1 Tax=Streptomyces sp. N35 TaxID=2795730 RepID=UPI0018F6F20E|nr:RraA family protein [Streptomyces sp. N35]
MASPAPVTPPAAAPATRPAINLTRVRAELNAAVICDVLDGIGLRNQALAHGIVPLQQEKVLAGFAFPVAIQRVYDVPEAPFGGLVAALDAIGPDEVFVTPTARATDIAVWGELLSTVSAKGGAAGALTDGLVRDTHQIRELGFPVHSCGTIPYDSKGRHEIVAHRVACVIDGVRIDPGDLIFGDCDGVVVVPHAVVEQVVEGAFAKRTGERQFLDAILEGSTATAAYARFGVL